MREGITQDPEEYIWECLEWIARHKAKLDQREKEFEDQYPMRYARLNRLRLDNIESERFRIEINEYELGGFIKDFIDSLEEE